MLRDFNVTFILCQLNKNKELEVYGNIKLLFNDRESIKKIRSICFIDVDDLVENLNDLLTIFDLFIDSYGYAPRFTMSVNKMMNLAQSSILGTLYKEIDERVKLPVINNEYNLSHLDAFLESRGVYLVVKEFLLSNTMKL